MPDTSRQRGFSLIELLAAMSVFLLVILAAYQVFQRSNQGYIRGQNQAEMIQSARVGFDQMVNDVRLMGFQFDIDGTSTIYPNQPDEALEYMHAHALTVRANFDFEVGNLRGRERGLERTIEAGEEDIGNCCPIVTTRNREVITYALGKNMGETQPNDDIVAQFDTTGTEAMDGNGVGKIRDATIIDDTITGEETVTIEDVALPGSGESLDDPPYVLYKLTVNEDGTIDRSPLIDNVKSLKFRYFDGNDTELTPNGGADGTLNADRDLRESVRRVRIELVTMEPQQDNRYLDPTDTMVKSRKHRKYALTEDVYPPNAGKRGIIDKSTNPPEPPTDVTVCVGQCRTVRVSWVAPPAEEQIRDYVISLFNGVPQGDLSNLLGTFVRVSDYDIVANLEYKVLNWEQDNDLLNGVNVYAQVVARDETGAESEVAESASGAVIVSETRPEPVLEGWASGYAAADANWPDARNDNSAGALVVTTSTVTSGDPPVTEPNPEYPQANAVNVTLRAPLFTLNETGSLLWTTKNLANGGIAAMECHRAESTPADATDDPALRTPVDNVPRFSSTNNTYVFRVSGSDPSNWNGGFAGVTVTDPRNFIPGPTNLHDFTFLPHHTELVTYTDESGSEFDNQGTPDNQYDDRYKDTKTGPKATGSNDAAPKAVTPGEVYYYRFRVVNICWLDVARDGYHDSYPVGHATPLAAWSLREDYASDTIWEDLALDISPFYPPLDPVGSGQNDRDEPDQGTDDSDEIVRTAGIDAYAVPGYAIPAYDTDAGAYVLPEKPSEFYLARMNENANALLAGEGARIVFNSSKRNAPATGVPDPVGYASYELHAGPASTPPTSAELDFTPSDSTLVYSFRTNGAKALLNYTLDSSAEGAPSADDGVNFLDGLGATTTQVYRLVTVQNKNFDDLIDPVTAGRSLPSRPFVFPCGFYDRVTSVVLTAVGGTTNTTGVDVAASVDTADDPPLPDPTCAEMNSARLLAYFTSGTEIEYLGTSDWMDTPDGCSFSFAQAAVTEARRGYTGAATYVVELSDTDNGTLSGDGIPAGCRVRSDLLGESGLVGSQSIACAGADTDDPHCGSDGVPLILGAVDDDSVTMGDDDQTINITIENLCTEADFSLTQVEVDLETTGVDDLPGFQFADIVGVTNGILPTTPDVNEPYDAGNGRTLRLRWRDSFLDSDTGEFNYPLVRSTSPEIVLRITFDAPICDVHVTAFNFRVLYDDGQRELLCTNRDSSDPDPDDPTLADPPGRLENDSTNGGRGPQSATVGDCLVVDCEQLCPDGTCPVNNAMTDPDSVETYDSPIFTPIDDGVSINYQETCVVDPDCVVTITRILATFQKTSGCDPDDFDTCLGGLADGSEITFDDGSPSLPLFFPDDMNEDDCCLHIYNWTGISKAIPQGAAFNVNMAFDKSMTGMELVEMTLEFGDPLPTQPTSCPVPASRLPLAIPTP